MKVVLVLFAILFLSSCDIFQDKPLYYKIIKTERAELKWYYYSRLTNNSPEFVDVTSQGKTVTICEVCNI